MRAIVVQEFGPISSHRIEQRPDPTPGAGEVLIDNQAIGLNFPDALMLQGKYQKRPERPFVPGRDCAGTVLETGPGVSRCRSGDRVVAQVFTGAFGERVVAPENRCFPLPDGVEFADAAAMITSFNTAWAAVDDRAAVQAGDTVMVTGASGGVGAAAVQLCRARGARVLAAVSSAEKGELARRNGADLLIDTKAADLAALKEHLKEQVAKATGAAEGKGCDAVLDTVGGDLFEAGLRVLRFAGKMVIIGFASGAIPTPRANYLLYNNLSVLGAPLDIRFDNVFGEVERGVNAWLGLLAAGKLNANIAASYDFDDFVAAFDQILGRKVAGKVVLRFNS